jgi:hypothetical protein
MTLNSSGPLSIGGCTTGQSIAKELGLSTTATHSLNCTSYRTLAGVSSGTISMSNFYGKSNATYMCITTSGASVSTCGSYKIARFTGSGSFTVNSLGSGIGNYANRINYVVVAGGGHGGYTTNGGGGAGGAGGVLNCCTCLGSSGFTVTTGTYTVSIGAGGTCSYGGYRSGDATCSSFSGPSNVTATRGGGGGCICYPTYRSKVNGGSGGGGGIYSGQGGTGGSAVSGQGHNGGNGVYRASGPGNYYQYGGGGGGAGTAGCAFRGGNGRYISFLATTYGGGGGGGAQSFPCSSVNCNNGTPGGSGGGGTGLNYHIICLSCGCSIHNTPSNGSPNTGGGGGGAGANFGGCCGSKAGGSGFVAIKWRYKA